MLDKAFPVRCNLHTHTTFCDGAHTPEENVLAALELGMEVLGFSEHCCSGFEGVFGMKNARVVALYRDEVRRLQAEYADRIRILLGTEQDFHAGKPQDQYEYVIGSVHYVLADGEYCPVDESAARTARIVNEHFGGDPNRYAKAYYENVASIAQATGCDIVGHFDLLAKFSESGWMFSTEDARYTACAMEALDALLEQDLIFEVNTGAISRGYRKTPYPDPVFLRRIAERGGRVMLNADAHSKEHLMCAFAEALELMRACGFSSVMTVTKNGWESRKI